MKRTRKAMWRSGLALMLVFSMMLGLCGTAFATDVASDETIQYVSLGDSMTNGYGLTGYDGNTGVYDYGEESYANLFAAWLADTYNAEVEHSQLAMSAMRAEDLHWLLELDYTDEEAIALTDAAEWDAEAWNAKFTTGDYWTWKELADDYRFATAATYIKAAGGDQGAIAALVEDPDAKHYTDDEAVIVAETYQTAVAEADIVSVGIGNGNIGVFALGRLMNAVGFDGSPEDVMVYNIEDILRECDDETKAQIMGLYDQLYAELGNYITIDDGDDTTTSMMEALAHTLLYCSVSYVVNYAGTIDAIVTLNPDAEIVIVGLMNTMAGMEFEYEGEIYDLGGYMETALDVINTWLAGYPAAMQLLGNFPEATFYYAEATEVDTMAANYGADIAAGNGVVRERFVEEIVGANGDGLVWSLMYDVIAGMDYELQVIDLAKIVAYENALMLLEQGATEAISDYATDQNTAISCAVYLAFENAVSTAAAEGGTMSLDSLMALTDMENAGSLFTGVMESFSANIAADSAAAVQTAAEAVINAQLTSMGEDIDSYIAKNPDGYSAMVNEAARNLSSLGMLLALPTTLSTALVEDTTVSGLLNMFARCLIGNGLGAHPSIAGHEELYNAVKTSYETGYTAGDMVADKAELVIDAAYDLVVEYYDDALLYAYNYAEENGYIDAAEAALAELQAELEVLKAELTAQAEGLSAEAKAAIEAEIAKIEAAIAEIEAIIAEAQNITEETYAQVLTLLGQIDASINEMLTLLGEAGTEISAELLAALVNSCNEIWNAYEATKEQLKSVIPEILEIAAEYLKDVLGDAYDALIEVMSDLAEEYGPKAVEAVYNYLLNNPEQVIAFVQEYGDDAVAFVKTYQNEILGALVFIATTYGEDIAEYIKNNPEEVLETLAYLVEEYGDEAWALIVVYADALGITDALQEVVADLNAQVDELNAEYAKLLVTLEEKLAEIEAQIAEIEKQIAAEKEKLEDCAASVKAEIEAKIEELEAMKAELEAKIEALKAYIAEVENAIAEAIVALNELADAIENVIDVIESGAIQEGIEEALNNLQAAIDAVGDAIVFAQNAADEINEVIAAIRAIDWEAVDAEIKAQIEAAAAQLEAYYQQVLAMIDQAESEFNAALYAATHAQYCICEEQYYVALGGNTGYAAALAEALEIELDADLTNAELNAGTLVDYVTGNAAEIAQATVITYNLEASSFVYDLFNAMLSNSDVDWSAYLDEDGLELSEELKAVLMEQLAAEYGEDAVSAIAPLAENLVYAFVEYAVETVKALGAVEQINEDALMLVVGMNNPLAGMTVTYGGQTVALGDMFEYLIDATNLYYTVYAMVTGSVVFVDASEAEINGTVTNVDLDNLDFYMLLQLDDSMKTSDAGNAYIAEQIENALILGTYELTETKAATCAEAGYEVYTCTVCGYSYTDPLEKTDAHIWGEWTETKEPTATENGEKTRTCTVCGKTETEVIPAIGECEHEYECTDGKDATCTEDGYKEYTCEKCGDTYTEAIEATGHDYTAVVTNPTCIKQGYTTYTCACGDSYVGDYTAATGHAGDCFCTNCGLHICDGGENCPSKAFSDLNPGSWYHEDTDYVIVTGLMNGMGNGKFKPDGETTRAMLVTTLYRLEGEPDYSTGNVYSDVANNKWYTDAILWATENNIVEGYGNGKFGPNDAITREQIATIFYRYAAFKGLATNQREDLSSYPDDEEISAWAQDAMEWCVAVGMIEGTVEHGVTYLAPEDATLRVQLATLLHRWQTEIMG